MGVVNMDMIYIFRKLALSNFYVEMSRIDEEVVFSKYAVAKDFMLKNFKSNASIDSLNSYRYEILQIELDCEEGYYVKEIYSINGLLLTREVYEESGCASINMLCPAASPASAGQIVLLYGNRECGSSPFVCEQIGVVLTTVDGVEESEMTLGYFEEDGSFSHCHGVEHWIKTTLLVNSHGTKESALLKAYADWLPPAKS